MLLTSSFIYIHHLKIHSYIGVSEQEKIVGNDYIIDLKIKRNIIKAIMSDDVKDTINYASVYEVIKKTMSYSCNLLEYAAGRIGESLFEQFPQIEAITILLTKKNPPMEADCYGASVELHLINEKNITKNIALAKKR